MDSFDVFREKLNRSATYPLSLIRSPNYGCDLRPYAARLSKYEHSLFSPDDCEINLLELPEGDVDFEDFRARDIRIPLDARFKDPKCRMIFLQIENNGSLKCSKNQLQYILTYHQVMFPYLDFLSSFGYQRTNELADFTSFKQRDTVFDPHDKRARIPRLGRSGAAMQHCFTVQIPTAPVDGSSLWAVRQAAVYHSFDLVTGRTLWLIGVNEEEDEGLRGGLRRMVLESDSSLAGNFSETSTSFRASLHMHLFILSHVVESWRAYVLNLCTRNPQLKPPDGKVAAGSDRDSWVAWLVRRRQEVEAAMHCICQTGTVLRVLGERMVKIREHPEMSAEMREASHYDINRVSEQVQVGQTELDLRKHDLERALGWLLAELKVHEAQQIQQQARAPKLLDFPLMYVITALTLVFLPGTFAAIHFATSNSLDSIFTTQSLGPEYQASMLILLLVFATLVAYAFISLTRRSHWFWQYGDWRWSGPAAVQSRSN